MMKFFRKNTKPLLAVFMALLLIVWLGGSALQKLFSGDRNSGKQVVGHAFGQPVRVRDFQQAKINDAIGQELTRFRSLSWNRPWAEIIPRIGLPHEMWQMAFMQISQMIPPLGLEEWYLLDAEAQHNGVFVSMSEVEQVRNNIPEEMLRAIRNQHRSSIAEIDTTIQSYLRVVQAAQRAAMAVVVSEADLQEWIRQTGEKVKVNLVVIDPTRLEDANYQPTDAEIQAQFDKYKNTPKGTTVNEFGYQLPDATQVEYIMIDVDAIAKLQEISDDTAFSYWEAHKNEFTQPMTQPESVAVTQPAPPKPYETFSAAHADVVKKLQREQALGIAERIGEDMIKQLNKPWTHVETTQPWDYKEAPASEQDAELYEKLIASRHDKYAAALRYQRTGIVSQQELKDVPFIGGASVFAGLPSQMPMSELAFKVAGLVPKEEKKDATESIGQLYRSLYQTCPEPVKDPEGNVYVFRNVAIRPAQAPTEIDAPLRERLIRDVRYAHAAEQAAKEAQALAEQARHLGLKTAFDGSEVAKKLEPTAWMTPESFPRGYGFIPGIGRDQQLVDLSFDLAKQASTTQPSPIATHQQKNGKWVVVEFKSFSPVTQDEYNQMRKDVMPQMLAQKRVWFVMEWFNVDQIHARTAWQPKKGDQEGNPEGGSSASTSKKKRARPQAIPMD